ncbi:MAG TPA: 4Fe-4S binding protein [Polyangiaceae bacterium]
MTWFIGAALVSLGVAVVGWIVLLCWRILLPSTLKLLRVNSNQLGRTLHAIIYYRWYEQYVRAALRYLHIPALRDWAVDNYHSKVITPELAQAIVTLDRDIPLKDLEQIVPYPNARNLMLSASPDVALTECPCRNIRESHCQPTQVCMVIGQPFVDFLLEHRPHVSRHVTLAEALELLKEEHERGHVHSAWFKDAFGGRMFAICNCCKCCCGAIEIMSKHGADLFAPSGFVARIDEDRCVACGVCEESCPFDAISAQQVASVDFVQCRGCGVCVSKCQCDAIALVRDESKGIPFDVRLLAGDMQQEQWTPPDAPHDSILAPRLSGFRQNAGDSKGRAKKVG